MIVIERNVKVLIAILFTTCILLSCKLKQSLQTIFYVKNNIVIANINNREYKLCEHSEGQGKFKYENIYYIEKENTYYLVLYGKNDEKNLYSVKEKDGDVSIKLLLNTKNDFDDKFVFLYIDNDRIYLSIMKPKTDNSNKEVPNAFASIAYLEDGELISLYSDIEIKNKYKDGIYYSCNNDTIFLVEYTTSNSYMNLFALKNGEKKLIDNETLNMSYGNDKMLCTSNGLYYNSYSENCAMYYDGNKHILFNDEYIYSFKNSNGLFTNNIYDEYFYLITYAQRKETVNLNDYIDFTTVTSDEIKKELKSMDLAHFKWNINKLYCIDKSIGNAELIANEFDEWKMRKVDGYLYFMTLKEKVVDRISLDELDSFIKKYSSNAKYDLKQKLSLYMSEYVYRDINYSYIYKQNVGTRINGNDVNSITIYDFIITDNNMCIAIGNDKLYMGDIRFNSVTQLKSISDENYDKVVGFKNRVFVGKSNKVDYDKYTYDWFEVRDEMIDGIEIDRANSIDISYDKYDNIFLYDKKDQSVKKYDREKLIVCSNGNINYLYKIDFITDRDNKGNLEKQSENFYGENPDRYSLISNSSNENNISDNELNIKNSNVDSKTKSESPIIHNYKKPDAKYLREREKYVVKDNNATNNIIFYIEDNKLYVNAYDKSTYLDESEYIGNGLAYKRLPEIICYDELNDEFYYDTYYSKQNGDKKFTIHKLKIDKKGNVKKSIKDEVVPEKDVLFSTEYMRYLGNIGKASIYVTSDLRIYAVRNKMTVLLDDVGQDGWSSISNNYLDSTIAINSFEKKLYYLKHDKTGDINYRLYEIDENLEKTVISDNVKEFVALQNEIFYVTHALYRYSKNKSERVMPVYDVTFAGKHNGTKCYMNVWKDTILSNRFLFDETKASKEERLLFEDFSKTKVFSKSLYLYENGEFVKVSDAENAFIPNYWESPQLLGTDKFLVFEVCDSGEKIDFHDFYETLSDEDKTNIYRARQKAENTKDKSKCYAMIIDGYDIYRTEIGENGVGDSIEELEIYDGYARYKYKTEKFEIYFGDNVEKKEKSEKKIKTGGDKEGKEVPIVRMTNNLY